VKELKKIEIHLIENDGKINKIRWKGGEILSDIDINELPEPIQTCINLAKQQEPLFLDGRNPATFLDDEYLEKFLDPDERSIRQQAIIKVLISNRDWLNKKQLAEGVGKLIGEKNLIPHNLAGPLAGFSNRLKSDGKESFIETRRISEGKNRKYKCYQIKDQYREKIRKIIEERWDTNGI
jgi:predicted transcriptional regulator with HTH domain